MPRRVSIGLEEKLGELFAKTKTLRLDLFLDTVQVSEDGTAKLNYRYEVRYQVSYPTGDRWSVNEDKNQMQLVLNDGSWKIVSGL